MTDRRMLIAGEWCAARDGRTFDRFNPATGALASRAPAAGPADADAAIDAAHRAFPPGRRSRRPSVAGCC